MYVCPLCNICNTTKSSRRPLFRTLLYRENHTKHINTTRGRMRSLLTCQQVLHTGTTGV